MLAGLVEDPAEVVIATETDRCLFVNTLVAAGYTVTAVNPMSPPAIGSGIRPRARGRIPVTRRSSPTSPAPTPTTTGRSLVTANWPRRSGPRSGASVDDVDPATTRQPAAIDAARLLPGCAARSTSSPAVTPFRSWRSRRHRPPAGCCRCRRSKLRLRRGGRQRRIDQRAVEIQTALRAEQLAAPDLVSVSSCLCKRPGRVG
jgi:hypothetical protein